MRFTFFLDDDDDVNNNNAGTAKARGKSSSTDGIVGVHSLPALSR